MTADTLPRLLTLSEVAISLRLSPHTIRSFVRKGKLSPVRICRRLLFSPPDIARLIAGATDSVPAAEPTQSQDTSGSRPTGEPQASTAKRQIIGSRADFERLKSERQSVA
jgi:hypothetical protein